jgi:methanogenic corrinoid protein MtbC1
MSNFNGSENPSPRLSYSNAANDECKETLLDVIEKEIIPRLLNSQQNLCQINPVATELSIGEPVPEMLAFTDYCVKGDALNVTQIVDQLIDRGLRQDRIFLELITPAARHLGVLWEKDECSFSDVTCGLAMMHQVTYRLGYGFSDAPMVQGETTRVMLSCAPGSQHFLGLTIVADFFRREGANVVIEISSTESELMRAVANEWFDVIGISVAIETQLPQLKKLIANFRKNSGNPHVRILLGGPIFTIQDHTAEQFGADAISTDAIEAVALLKNYSNK